MSADISDPRKEEYLRRASGAARARDMMGFLNACQRAGTSAYGLLAELQASDSLLPEERANLATVAREMDCYRGKHGRLPHEQPTDGARRRWFRPR
ncbi:MAG: hypothetical protein E6I76_14970 [Chloroflexi bacterium]|nr:MAG: hypothetical protein E6I76_14970 [Chloroflexota bacterium]